MAILFAIEAELGEAPTMGALRDGVAMTKVVPPGKVAPMYMRQQMAAPVDIKGARLGVHTVCTVPFPIGDDAGRAMALMDKAEELPMKCARVEVTAAPAAQTLIIKVPTAWTLPPP
jgi:hypothetical protein